MSKTRVCLGCGCRWTVPVNQCPECASTRLRTEDTRVSEITPAQVEAGKEAILDVLTDFPREQFPDRYLAIHVAQERFARNAARACLVAALETGSEG